MNPALRIIGAALIVGTLGLAAPTHAAQEAQDGAAAAPIAAVAPRAALQKVLETCSTCHGSTGHSVSRTFPNLAAQSAPYIEAQLHAFKDQTRADPDAQAYMWGMAAQLDDASITGLAEYFSKQSPPGGKSGNAKMIAQGKEIFVGGVPDRGIPACASCHGPLAQGNGPFPRLAGQHAPYLLKQLLVIQSVLRTAPVMHGVIKNLSRDQMQAVVAYLESI